MPTPTEHPKAVIAPRRVLAGQKALVTGANSGIGRAVAIHLAREGADVAVNYVAGNEAAQQVIDEIKRNGGNAIALKADVSKEADVQRMFRLAEERFSRIDVVVNNAGVWPTAYVKDMTEQQWNHTLAVNLTGPFLTSREAVRRWLASGRTGRIVNISSQAAFRGSTTGHADYAASKAGLVAFTASLAREVAPHGIHVNALAAGMMATDMARDVLQQNAEAYLQRIPLGRIADPAEIANVVVFMASERASYMTGATVDVSGGMLMR